MNVHDDYVVIQYYFLSSHADAPEEKPIHDSARKDKDELGVIFLAFAQIFSGTLHKDQTVFVLHPRHDPQTCTVACVWSDQLPAAEDITGRPGRFGEYDTEIHEGSEKDSTLLRT